MRARCAILVSGIEISSCFQVALLINRILTIVPEERRTPAVETCLQRMSDSTVILSAKCNAPMFSANDTCSAAYAVANSAKQLLVTVHQL